ncbi:MAG: hypothetical protein ACOY4L_08945 [Pseudomonadota bacterium]
MICVCESEMLLYQLHLYTRRLHPGASFDERALRDVLQAAGITAMRQLFALDSDARRHLAAAVLSRLPDLATLRHRAA